MKTSFLILALLLCCVSGSDASRRRALMMQLAASGGGGPDTYYDVEVLANADQLQGVSDTERYAATVTVAQAGTATKMRVMVRNSGASTHNVKVACYSNGGSLLGTGTVAVLSTDDDVNKDVTFDTPFAVTATTYILSVAGDHADLFFWYKAGTGAEDIFTGGTYAGFPPDPIGSPTFDDLSRNLVIGLYVD